MVARWAIAPIGHGHPGFVLTPIVQVASATSSIDELDRYLERVQLVIS